MGREDNIPGAKGSVRKWNKGRGREKDKVGWKKFWSLRSIFEGTYKIEQLCTANNSV